MNASAIISREFDVIQKFLIPRESSMILFCMNQASQLSQKVNFFTKRIFPIPFIVVAIPISLINSVSYFLQIPFISILNVIQGAPLRFLTDPVIQIINTARSILFFGLGIPLLISGMIFPEAVYSRFTFESVLSDNVDIVNENKTLKIKVENLENALKAQRVFINEQFKTS